ncbi:hypothetical protein NPIL_460911 [Nephila pilipes]|uniref:Uncharacterized protein n=1 Tax=Nephila pilipes TaxID=299642 RepID=A0A8X6NDE1_NEPPI|nr:hypothetical protein NPIL_460911 [Nephila pilipes]
MADDQRLLTDDRTDKRKCDDFAALYGLEGAAARALPDHSGKSSLFPSQVLALRNKFNKSSRIIMHEAPVLVCYIPPSKPIKSSESKEKESFHV